jgi:hypothetical protein
MLLNKKFADTVLLILGTFLVIFGVQTLLDQDWGIWATVIMVVIWIVGLYRIWRPKSNRS